MSENQINLEQEIAERQLHEENNPTTSNSTSEAEDQTKDLAIERRRMEHRRGLAIATCIDLESTFKLYSYRCISHEQFVERVDHLTSEYSKTI